MPVSLQPARVFRPVPQPALKPPAQKRGEAVVVGAGVFGGWTARKLQQAGFSVTLFDAWGAGHSRASSGGESRVLRAVYGDDRDSVRNVAKSLKAWRNLEEESGEKLFHETGVLWLLRDDDAFVRASLPYLNAADLQVLPVEPAEARKLYPQMSLDDFQYLYFEPEAGFLLARRACQALLRVFKQHGGRYKRLQAAPGPIRAGKLESVELSDGSSARADLFVFACGPWLGKIFPEVIGERVRPTRQEVLYFGAPAGRPEYTTPRLPVWLDHGAKVVYGIPAGEHHAFKVADDTRGERFDPDKGERLVSKETVEAMRAYLALRFPGLKGAPLVDSRVCQYEETQDRRFIMDRHPEAANLLLVGGGSGHGFKQGPAVGELAAAVAAGRADPPRSYSLARLRL